MAYTIESRTVGTNDLFGFSPPVLQGYWREGPGSYGQTNIDQYGSVLYAGSDWSMILWQGSNDTITLQIEGHVNDQTSDNLEGWDAMIIDGTTFNRSSATITTVFSASAAYYKIKTQWTWAGVSTSPFGATGRSITVSWRHNGYAPTAGAISLNQIHQEAGGSSGTQVSINDSDVRGKSWYGRVAGSTPASGATQDFADFYYPRLFGADQSGTTYPARIWKNTETTYQGTGHRTGYVQADYIRSRDGGFNTPYNHDVICGAAVQANGTDTIIYMVLSFYNTGQSARDYFDWGDNERTVSSVLTEIYRIPGVSVDKAALYSVIPSGGDGVDYTHGTLYQNENPTTGNGSGGATWTNAAYLSTNSISSFTSLTSTSNRYGRQYRVRHTTSDEDVIVSNLRVHFRFRLRQEPTTTAGYWERDIGFNIRCYLETDTTP